jgi:hypothetical protein
MAYRDMPDCKVPPNDQRCEAMTKPTQTYQDWRRTSHRCVRRAVQGRDGHGVCSLHARLREVTYCSEAPDTFRHKPFWKWPYKLQRFLHVAS